MRSVLNAIRTLSKLGGYVAGGLLVATTALIGTEIFLRLFLGRSTQVAEEYASYFLAAMIYLATAYTLIHQEHIRVEILRDRLGERGKVWLERFALLIGVVFAALLSYAFFQQFWSSLSYGSRSFMPSRTPLAIPHGAILVGAVLLFLQFSGLLIESFLKSQKTEEPS